MYVTLDFTTPLPTVIQTHENTMWTVFQHICSLVIGFNRPYFNTKSGQDHKLITLVILYYCFGVEEIWNVGVCLASRERLVTQHHKILCISVTSWPRLALFLFSWPGEYQMFLWLFLKHMIIAMSQLLLLPDVHQSPYYRAKTLTLSCKANSIQLCSLYSLATSI